MAVRNNNTADIFFPNELEAIRNGEIDPTRVSFYKANNGDIYMCLSAYTSACNGKGSPVAISEIWNALVGPTLEVFDYLPQRQGQRVAINIISDIPKNNLSTYLKNKLQRIYNQTAAGGNRGITGSVTENDALKLGQAFVGPNYRIMSNGAGYVSADGLRTFRFPANKSGTNPATGQAWSTTGRQVNFETKNIVGDKPVSNVHLDVIK